MYKKEIGRDGICKRRMRDSKALRLYTHTHTHTHTRKFSDKRKIIEVGVSVAIVVVMAIVVIQLFMKKEIIEESVVTKTTGISELDGSEVDTNLKESTKPKAMVDTSSWDTSKVTVYTDKSENKAPIPVGYVVSQVIGETEINTGLVIYEGTEPVAGDEVGVPGTAAWDASCNRNQWVWVPVPDVSRIYDKSTRKSKTYKRTQTGREEYSANSEPVIMSSDDNEQNFSKYNLPGMTTKKLYYELDTELDETIKSIEKYGGFYIGRYETGNVKAQNVVTYFTKPVVKRMNRNINYVTWYDAYANLRTLGANENVKSNIIWGCLWDETLQWFRESGAKTDEELYNPATWGNYRISTFRYYENTTENQIVKSRGSETMVPTGSAEQNKANNVYDMAGNVSDWTLECSGGYRRGRGSTYNTNTENAIRDNDRNYGKPNSCYSSTGVRAYMYIK